jgi:hypothetical protein
MIGHSAAQRGDTIGIDLGKNTFHMIGMDGRGKILLRQKLSRGQAERHLANLPRCLISMGACAGAHPIGRQFTALGHDIRLLPAQYFKPFRKGHKNDFRDAEGLCCIIPVRDGGPALTSPESERPHRARQAQSGHSVVRSAFEKSFDLLIVNGRYNGRNGIFASLHQIARSRRTGDDLVWTRHGHGPGQRSKSRAMSESGQSRRFERAANTSASPR